MWVSWELIFNGLFARFCAFKEFETMAHKMLLLSFLLFVWVCVCHGVCLGVCAGCVCGLDLWESSFFKTDFMAHQFLLGIKNTSHQRGWTTDLTNATRRDGSMVAFPLSVPGILVQISAKEKKMLSLFEVCGFAGLSLTRVIQPYYSCRYW